MIYGIKGKILRVNLTDSKVNIEDYDTGLVEKYLGGRGLGARYLYDEVDPAADPLGADNKLIFMNGPLAGSMIPGSNKINLTFKSPLSGTYSYSLCGGHWGPEIKFAGYDGIIIEGKAEVPSYVWIDDDSIKIKPVESLWGKNIPETEELIRHELGGDESIQIAAIGRAGELLNKMACITAGWYREFGRGGCGAVMGSKNLKAIAVRGTGDVTFKDAQRMKSLSEELCDALRKHPKGKDRRNYGTPEMVKGINNLGFLCANNFKEGHFEEGYKLEGPQMRKDIVVGDASCYSCPVACGKRSYVKSDGFGEVLLEGPEFESIGLLGSNCGVSDWNALLKAVKICDEYGFDTINAGACVSLVMECFEKGILTEKDTGGIEARFGNGRALVDILSLMAERKGIGDILAEGVRAAGEKFGAPDLAIHSKGQAFAVYDPRGCKGMALTYATSPKGAHHMVATTMGPEIAEGTRLSEEGKGKLQRTHQFSMCIVDSAGLCATMRVGVSPKDIAVGITAATGIEMTPEKLNLAAERTINLEKLYNLKLGLSRKDDTIPQRFLKEKMTKGESAGYTVDLESMLDEYYESMGWDSKGVPGEAKLKELDLI